MTELERQVGEALERHMTNDPHVTLRAWAESLAPRVAAAIEAAVRGRAMFSHDAMGDALAALRGEKVA